LERDTSFLCDLETIDYSLLLGRCTYSPSSPPPQPETWHTGISSPDKKFVYRASIVDFFWNINKALPTIARVAGKPFPEQTITTEPGRYKAEWMEMMQDYIVVKSPNGSGAEGSESR
jgi:Phosphatidylinositol-4-phosphate 5-Kinase